MMAASSSHRPRGLASKTLKSAGLISRDEDASMRDLSQGSSSGRKKPAKKIGHRQRGVDLYKASGTSDLSHKMLASRISANLSNPLAVRGAALKPAIIRPGSSATRVSQVRTLDVWREIVQKRYNPEAKFLNLECLADDEVLKKHNITPPGLPGSNHKEYPVIFKLASQLKPPVETISLANNNLQMGTHLAPIAHYLPNLRNLSLQSNKLKSWRDLDYLAGRNRKLGLLRELIFLDNPLRDQEMNAGRAEQYKSGMSRRFPSLEVLDQEAITKISFVDMPVASSSNSGPSDESGPSSFPLPMAPSFITGVDGSVISGFLARFFPLFDSQRSALIDAYDPSATFSYSAFTTIPPRARLQGWHTSKEMPNQRRLEWGPWLKNDAGGSRNLNFIGRGGASGAGLDRELRSLHAGPTAIVTAMSHLPKTHHEVAGAADKFCIDAWPVGQGAATMLFLCIHGEFTEEPSRGIRSFDRTFILAPAPPGSTAAMNNWAVTILSDQLTVRPYSSPDAWKAGPMKVQGEGKLPRQHATPRRTPAAQQPFLAPEVQAQLNVIPEPQRSLVVTVCQRTGLNVRFSVDCLDNNGWDIERAVANFEQVKPSLGQEAFL
ncbi:hypothetical protein EW145_g2122 [Phellinidium pouzarii]|uniref:TAP-C domain-containing protein n=1 Tax=Phellinidium pouzarii TaxID=167371 RepID=A0A4S4LHK0_9AGAM|nr:hypothetical protein EW145_g2122 [Phellinidium pouzarii]